MDVVFSYPSDLTNQPISNPDIECFTSGSIFVWDGTHFVRYAVVSLDAVTEACPLSAGTSAQKAKLIAHMWALQLTAGVQVNIYTHSKYAFTTIHVHGALYKEKGLINLGRKNVKYGQEILELLKNVWAPKLVAVTLC
jgi:hypothetical protein